MSTSITATGIPTGSIETPGRVRNGVAFDLTAITANRVIVAAQLRIRRGAGVVVNDSSGRVRYGARRENAPGQDAIRLNTAALEDLQLAKGTYFWIETSENHGHAPGDFARNASCTLDLTVTGFHNATGDPLEAVA